MSDTAGYSGTQDLSDGAAALNATTFIVQQLIGQMATAMLVQVRGVTNAGGLAAAGTVDVQPMVNQIDGAGNATPHDKIFGLPYLRIQGGLNAVIIDPEVGDIGVAVFASRDISSVRATRKVSNPGTRRTYSWSDGLYLGGFLNGVPTQYVQFNAGGIAVVTPADVTVTAGGNVVVKAQTVDLTADTVNLGGTGGMPVARVGDTVNLVTGVIETGSDKVNAT